MRLVHFSREVYLPPLHNALVGNPLMAAPGKPNKALWISDEDTFGWSEWCEKNDFVQEPAWAPICTFEIELVESPRVLILDSVVGVRMFGEAYRPGKPLIPSMRMNSHIDFSQVMVDYDAVIITPYQWSIRLHPEFFWYYGWDCAGGFILCPARCIAKITRLPEFTWGGKMVNDPLTGPLLLEGPTKGET